MNWPAILATVLGLGFALFSAAAMYVHDQTQNEERSKRKPPCPACNGSGFSENDAC